MPKPKKQKKQQEPNTRRSKRSGHQQRSGSTDTGRHDDDNVRDEGSIDQAVQSPTTTDDHLHRRSRRGSGRSSSGSASTSSRRSTPSTRSTSSMPTPCKKAKPSGPQVGGPSVSPMPESGSSRRSLRAQEPVTSVDELTGLVMSPAEVLVATGSSVPIGRTRRPMSATRRTLVQKEGLVTKLSVPSSSAGVTRSAAASVSPGKPLTKKSAGKKVKRMLFHATSPATADGDVQDSGSGGQGGRTAHSPPGDPPATISNVPAISDGEGDDLVLESGLTEPQTPSSMPPSWELVPWPFDGTLSRSPARASPAKEPKIESQTTIQSRRLITRSYTISLDPIPLPNTCVWPSSRYDTSPDIEVIAVKSASGTEPRALSPHTPVNSSGDPSSLSLSNLLASIAKTTRKRTSDGPSSSHMITPLKRRRLADPQRERSPQGRGSSYTQQEDQAEQNRPSGGPSSAKYSALPPDDLEDGLLISHSVNIRK